MWWDSLLSWFNQNAGAAQWGTLLITLIIGGLAFWIGLTQNAINKSIEKLQDSVEIFAYAVPGSNSIFLRLSNVGTVQVYLTSYRVNAGTLSTFDRALIPVAQQQNAWFDIEISPLEDHSDKGVLINLEDQLKRVWESKITMTYRNGAWVTTVHQIENQNKQ